MNIWKKDFGKKLLNIKVFSMYLVWRTRIKALFITFFAIALFISNIPILNQFMLPVMPFFLILGTVLLLCDLLCMQIKWLKIPYLFITLFVCSYFITIILNYPHNLVDQLKTLCWFCMFAYLLGSIATETEWATVKKTLRRIAHPIILLSFLTALVSLYFFVVDKAFRVVNAYDGIMIDQGYFSNRLIGIYQEPNFGAWYALFSIIISYWLLKDEERNNKLIRVYLISNIIIQIFYFVLSNSRGGLVAAVALVFLSGMCYLLRSEVRKNKKRFIIGIMATILIAGGIFPIRLLTQNLLAYVPASVSYIQQLLDYAEQEGNNGEESKTVKPPSLQIESVERKKYGNTDISTNRIPAWTIGFNTMVKQNILFGLGDRNIKYYVNYYYPQEKTIAHNGSMSSSFFRLLVSSGIIGTLIIMVFGIYYAVTVIKTLIGKRLDKNMRLVLEVSFVCVGTCLAATVFLEDLFLYSCFSALVFWGFIGLGFFICKGAQNREDV